MPAAPRRAACSRAYLAEQGFTGSLDALEAPFGGFMSTLHGQSDAATILTDLGERWETARVGLKPYAACASAHTTIDGVRELRARGLDAGNLARLTVRMSKKSHLNIGWPYQPGEVITAQMNGSYAAAVTLLDGDAFIDQYDETAARRSRDPGADAADRLRPRSRARPRRRGEASCRQDRSGTKGRQRAVDDHRATPRFSRSSSVDRGNRAKIPPARRDRAAAAGTSKS